MRSPWPFVIHTAHGDYQRCSGLYLARLAPDGSPPPDALPLRDSGALLEAAGFPVITDGPCPPACCNCTPAPKVSRRPTTLGPSPPSPPNIPLNRPPGTCWVRSDTSPDRLPPGLLPVYRGSDGVFAVDPGRVRVSTRPRPDGEREHEYRETVHKRHNFDMRAFASRLRRGLEDRRSSLRADLHWIPAISPIASVLQTNWHRRRIHTPEPEDAAWGAYKDGFWDRAALVAVIDAGIVRDHPDLPGGNIDLWYPSTGSLWSPESSVEVDHGTSVVGIIIANGQADFAATGLAPSCAVLACDVMDWNFDSICGAVDHATRHDSVRVLSLSFSYYTDAWPPIPNNEGELAAALQRAQDTGVLICAAAGNTFADDRMTIGFPACYPGVMVVGAIDEYDDTDNIPGTTRWFSRYRPTSYEGVMARVSVVAPGYEVLTTRIGPWGEYLAAGFAGTSASTPQVAALAGLLFNRHPHLTAGDVRRIIESTAEKLDTYTFEWDREGDPSTRHPKIGHGCIDVTAALTLADVYPESPAVVTVGDRLELRLTVRNRGPIAAIAVSVRVWVLRPDEPWKLVADPGREGASDLYTYDAATPLKPEASQTVVDTLQPDGPQPVSVFVLPQGSRVLIVVDAANDHAFHRALASQPASGGNHRFYNNIALRQVEG